MNMEQQLQQRLAHLNPEVFEWIDDSHLHVGHAGNRGGGHYRILVVSAAFTDVSQVMRQRMIKEPLHDLFRQIHAQEASSRPHTWRIFQLTHKEKKNHEDFSYYCCFTVGYCISVYFAQTLVTVNGTKIDSKEIDRQVKFLVETAKYPATALNCVMN